MIVWFAYYDEHPYDFWSADWRVCPGCHEHLDDRTEGDLTSPFLFPYAPASVCSLWPGIMSRIPKFWRLVVILVDVPGTPLSVVEEQLAWSRDRRLEVIVTRRALYEPIDGQQEWSNVIALMKILHSHIHCIKRLRFDVMFSSSLPSFPPDFHGIASTLKDLELQRKEDDGGTHHNELIT